MVVNTDKLETVLESFVGECDKQNVPCVFALGRKALGRACAKPVPISVVGILSSAGIEVFTIIYTSLFHHQLVVQRKKI